VFDTEKEANIGLQPSLTKLLGIRQGFGAYFVTMVGLIINKNSHLGILELGLHPKVLWAMVCSN
jgi:hypothetical protein